MRNQPGGEVLKRGIVAALGLDAKAVADAAEEGVGGLEVGGVEEGDDVFLVLIQSLGDGLEESGLAAADRAIDV